MAKPLPVIFSESAIVDLEEIRNLYREQLVPDIGEHFLQDIIAKVEGLPAHPSQGRVVPEFNQPHLRELIHPPFRIVYRLTSKQIAITRIWRSERLLKRP